MLEARQRKTLDLFQERNNRPPTTAERELMALFPTNFRNRDCRHALSYNWFRKGFKNWIDSLDIGCRVPHQAHHSLATSLLRADASLSHVRAAAAGPANPAETARGQAPALPADRARQLARLPRTAAALWFTALGILIRAGRRTPLPAAPDTDLGRYAWSRAACRQVLLDKPARPGNLAELIALAADEQPETGAAPSCGG